jgi:hypothetical protein
MSDPKKERNHLASKMAHPQFLLVVVLLLPMSFVLAQGPASVSVSGTVTDATGAILSGATITLTNGTGLKLSTTSNAQGNYKFSGLQPGTYNIEVTAPGFTIFHTDNLTVTAAQQLPLDVSLEPGAENTNITVQGKTAAEVETETAEVSGTITQKEIVTLGLNGRNFTQLITLAPGVSNQTGQDEGKVGVLGSAKFSVNGGRVEYNSFEIDGSDVLNAGINASHGQPVLIVTPSLDALSEVKILTSNYGAEYGKSASGTVQASTKAGGANFHGNLYEFVRNEIFNARNYFDPVGRTPEYRRNDFGGTVGGPLFIPGIYDRKASKTHFFLSEEVHREISPPQFPFNQAVPSNAERAGIFNDVCPTSGAVAGGGGFIFHQSAYPDCPIYNYTGTAGTVVGYPNNTVPVTSFAKAILTTGLIPQPNSTSGCNSPIGSCYVVVPALPNNWHEELFRIDQELSSKINLMFRFVHDSWDATIPTAWQSDLASTGYAQNSFPTVLNKFEGPGVNALVQLDWTISPNMLNSVSFGYTGESITLTAEPGTGVSSLARPSILDAPCGATDPATGYTQCPMGVIFNNGFGGKIPGIVIGGSNQVYGGSGFAVDTGYTPWNYANPTYQFRDTLSKSFGRHTIQIGAQAYLGQQNELSAATGANTGDTQGILFYNNVNSPFTTGNAFADFLIGPTNAQGEIGAHSGIQKFEQDSTQYKDYNRYTVVEPYVQDNWRVTPRLTLNLGLRLSLFGLWHEKYDNAYNWEPQAYSPALASTVVVDPQTGHLVSSLTLQTIPLDLNNLKPAITNGLVRCGVNGVPSGCMQGHVFNPAPRIGFAWDPTGSGKVSIRAGYGIFYEHGTSYEANTGSLIGSAPLVISMTQNQPFTLECINGGRGQTGCATGGAFPVNTVEIPTKIQWPYVQQWSFSIERQLSERFVGTIAYVGSKGTHLAVEGNANQIALLPAAENPFSPGQPLTYGTCQSYNGGSFQVGNTTVTSTQPAFVNLLAACFGELPGTFSVDPNALRQYAPTIGQINDIENAANSTYNAFQATVRSTKGPVTVIGAYTYSHSIDDSSDRSDATFVNLINLAANRASSSFDQRHLLNIGYVIQEPFRAIGRLYNNIFYGSCSACQPQVSAETRPKQSGPGRPSGGPHLPEASSDDNASRQNGGSASQATEDTEKHSFMSSVVNQVFLGWEFSGITTYQSGTPFSVINQGSSTIGVLDNAGVANGLQYGSYPDVVPSLGVPFVGMNNLSFGPLLGNPGMFVAPQGLTLGNVGRNFLNNPGRTNFDMSLLKTWRVFGERVLQFRVEAFNVFNHTQFNIYDPLKGNTGSNVISCYGPASTGYSAAGGDGTNCLIGNSFLHPVDAHQPRILQLGAKFTF